MAKALTSVRSGSAAPLYLPGDGLELVLCGDWNKGGPLEFNFNGQREASLRFAAAPWTVLALLMQAGIDALHWFDAYVSTTKLVDFLEDKDVLAYPTQTSVYKQVSDIRASIAARQLHMVFGATELTAKQWAAALLDSHRKWGYRIALPPDKLRLIVAGKTYTSKSP